MADERVAGDSAPAGNSLRRERLREMMARERLDALVCRLPENVLLLTGYWPVCGWVYAVLPFEGQAVCIAPDTEEQEARAELQETTLATYTFGTKELVDQGREIRRCLESARGGGAWRRVGFEGSFEAAAPAWSAAESCLPAAPSRRLLEEAFGASSLMDVTGALESERSVKTPYEVAKVRRASRIACFGLQEFSRGVAPGARGVELVAAVESAILVKGTGFEGARRVRAFAQVATGPEETFRGWRPAEVTTNRRLANGEIALLELAVVADGFWCDRTRARVAGRATERQLDVHEVVLRAQEAAIAAARSSVTGAGVDEAARVVIRKAGLDSAFVHITGHGLGYRYHESLPLLAPWSRDSLAAGMVHSVEPGVYLEDFGGIRIEDDILVTDKGGEVLGAFSTDLS